MLAGTAPGVKLISLDVFDLKDETTFDYIIKAIDWAVANRDTYNITVINMSLGGGAYTGEGDTLIDATSQGLGVSVARTSFLPLAC